MPHALTPDNKLPRLIRFHEPIAAGLICTLDAQNILRINRAEYDKLLPVEQHMLLRTHLRYVESPPIQPV